MTIFLKLLDERDKSTALLESCTNLREKSECLKAFQVSPESFLDIPGAPFAYWVSEAVRRSFLEFEPFGHGQRVAEHGGSTKDDYRFLRVWWEPNHKVGDGTHHWTYYAKGGTHSPFYADIPMCVNWRDGAKEIAASVLKKYPYLNGDANWVLHQECNYFEPGLFQTLRSAELAPHLTPRGCVFGHNGFQASVPIIEIFAWLALLNSAACDAYIKLMLGRAGWALYTAGAMNRVPAPNISEASMNELNELGRRAWYLRRRLDTINEGSHAFILPAMLLVSLDDYDPPSIQAQLAKIQTKIDDIAFKLFGFSDLDRAAALGSPVTAEEDDVAEDASDHEDDDGAEAIDETHGLLSWAAGVAFGRFDWRLATGEREGPPEPDPFDPLPAKSPGMLPDGAEPFHAHSGILVDDQGHPDDLARLTEEVLARVKAPMPADVGRWLQRDFFPLHLKLYSKSRRKAPIYWPLSTTSGSYTLWLYYPSLTSQTLYTAVNDFVEPKLKQVGRDATTLRDKGAARSRDDEKAYEVLQAFELELIELRDTLLQIAPTYRPNHDDGVQITAAPLWKLFRHKPWQKILKDTWAKMEKGDYDWAHLAMAYWPDRVREKCKADKSLAIAHDLEHLYVEPEAQPKKARKKRGDA